MRGRAFEVPDEDLRALCNIAGVRVAVHPHDQRYILYLARPAPDEKVPALSLAYSATREEWETAIRYLVGKGCPDS